MNFAAVRQFKGRRDEKNFPLKVDMFGQLTEIGGTFFNDNKTACAKCKIVDDMNEAHNVRLMTTIPAMNLLNTRQAFSIYAYDGTYQGNAYVGYSGFWKDNVARQQSPQSSPQRPQNRPQSTQGPNGRDTSIERQCAWKSACTLAAERADLFATIEDVERCAGRGLYFIKNGKPVIRQPAPAAPDNGPPPTDDDIPF
jgi:hypothetical protein